METKKDTAAEQNDPLFDLLKINKSKYKQKTEQEYDEYIKSLTNFELDRHAASVGILPSPRASKSILLERLRRKFAVEGVSFAPRKIENNEIASLSQEDEAELSKFFRR